jgi:hypothetical protein
MEEIIALKNSVMLDHPVIFCRDKRLQYHCCNIGMVRAAKGVANIMEQCADNVLFIFTCFSGAVGGL